MRLGGAVSNPLVLARLEAAARARSRIGRKDGLGQAPVKPPLRLPMGAIQTAVLDVLGSTGGSLRTGEIHLRVEARLGRPVSRDTVASFLSVAARDAGSPVRRGSRGWYGVCRALG
jgi:hypothetical protein